MTTYKEELTNIFQGELAAVNAYETVIAKVDQEPVAKRLRDIKSQHEKASQLLKGWLQLEGQSTPKDAGTWGSFTKSLTKASSVLGEYSALAILKQGEEHGRRKYKELLSKADLTRSVREAISTQMLPLHDIHISSLDGMMKYTK
ncbi:DUF2383 domain-containing protein [bacterium]|nr:DUF2383 domain-containing protein [bacterium]